GGAPDDGVVDQDHPLVPHRAGDDVQLDAHAVFPLLLVALDEGAADVFVLDEADAVGDAAGLGVAQSGVQARVGHADDHVGVHRVLLRQEAPRLHPGLVDRAALDGAVGPGKVDVFKHAHLAGLAAAVVLDAAQAVGVGHHDLAGFHVPQQGGAHGVQGAALAGKSVAAPRQGADAQGPVAPGVPHRDQLGGGHDDQAVGPFQLLHGGGHRLLDAFVPEAVAGQQVADDLGVGRAVEDGPVVFQRVAQLDRVGQVAVVAQGHGAPAVPDDHGLGVGPHPAAGGGVADMAGGHAGLG